MRSWTISCVGLATVLLAACSSSARQALVPPTSTPTTAAAINEIRPASVDGVELVPITISQRRECQNIADETHSPVPCPGLIPNPVPMSLTAANCASPGDVTCGNPQVQASGAAPTLTYFVWNQYSFHVPAGYVGVPDQRAANGGPLGHFVIYSAKNLNVARDPASAPETVPSYCTRIDSGTTLLVHGIAARMYECSDTADATSIELHLGHELVVWQQAAVTCEVSFHGHSRTNQDLALAVARSTSMVLPAAP